MDYKISTINPEIDESWKNALYDEFNKAYFYELKQKLLQERKQFTVYPKGKDIFKAFDLTPLDQLKVVIIGQDPYHGPNQANGLCFSVNDGIKHPPSLENIFKELSNDLGYPYPKSGDLSKWAKQGVLLLNASLTVRKGQANAHANYGWHTFTDAVIKTINEQKKDIVFLLWGGFAKKKQSLIDAEKHHILTSGHPSPLSANKGHWFGNKHFSKTNDILISLGKQPIDWKIE